MNSSTTAGGVPGLATPGSGKRESRERRKTASAGEKEGPHGAYNAG